MLAMDGARTPEREPEMATACSPQLATVHRRTTKPSHGCPLEPSKFAIGAHITAVPLQHSAIGERNAAQWEQMYTSGRVHRANCIDSPSITTLVRALASMIEAAPLSTISSASGGGRK